MNNNKTHEVEKLTIKNAKQSLIKLHIISHITVVQTVIQVSYTGPMVLWSFVFKALFISVLYFHVSIMLLLIYIQ